MNPYNVYLERIFDMYMKTHPNCNPDTIREQIQEFANQHFKNIPCQLHNNITHETINTSVCDTFDWIEQRQPIVSGNGTFFMQHEEYLAPTVVMLETLQGERKTVKNEMWGFDKKSIEYRNRDTTQGSIKVIMNADYGAAGSPLSPFYSCYIPPATTGSTRVMTTTLICCLEMLSANQNKWAKIQDINGLFDLIYIVLEDTEERELIKDIYSPDEVTDQLLTFVLNYTMYDRRVLRSYLSTLTDDQRTKLMLAFNVRLVLRKYLVDEVAFVMDYLKAHQLDFEHVTKESLQDAGFGPKAPEAIQSSMERINKIVCDNCCYAFILNDNEARAAEMERLIVCTTDTDSLMVHFSSYLDEFQAHTSNFRNSCILAAAIGMRLFVENIIPKMVNYIAFGCNIKDEYYRKKFVFKNEFGFLAMSIFAKKMYAASMYVQEGTPRDIHDIEIKGLSFKKRDTAEFLEPIMCRLYDKYILSSESVSVNGILDEYQALRDRLRQVIDHDPSYYQVLGLKDVSAYDPNKVLPEQMRGALIWNHIMPDEELLPLDRVIVIRLSFDLLEQHQGDDARIAEILRLSLINNEKRKTVPFICLPEHYKEIPEWIRPVIDRDGSIDKLLTPFKQILGLFDVDIAETRGGCIASRMMSL